MITAYVAVIDIVLGFVLQGAAGAALQIGISQSGIAVFQNATRVSFFHWPKISKVQFKRKFFIVHVIVNSEVRRLSALNVHACPVTRVLL